MSEIPCNLCIYCHVYDGEWHCHRRSPLTDIKPKSPTYGQGMFPVIVRTGCGDGELLTKAQEIIDLVGKRIYEAGGLEGLPNE